ncbi:MAG TPA: OmpA family protein [Terriglobales bacterium]|nr:OmpA family protein [Terriglobales bacterium]
MNYCGNCGTQIGAEQSFCAGCGARVRTENPGARSFAEVNPNAGDVTQKSSEATLPKLATLKTQAPPPTKSSRKKILIAILVVVFVGAIAAAVGVAYVGYRVKQKKASAALDDLEGKSGTHKTESETDVGDPSKAKPGDSGSSSGGDSDNPLAGVLGKLQAGDGGSTPTGNMAKDIIEDLGVKNPEIPSDLVRNIPYSALTNPLPCPATIDQIDPAKLASGKIIFKPGAVLTDSWSLPLADAESDNIIRSVAPASLIFEYNGVGASDTAMRIKFHPDFNQTVCAKDVVEGEAYATGWSFKSVKEPVAPGLYPGVSFLLVPGARFNDLKSTGSTKWVHLLYYYMDALNEWELVAWRGTLTRVEPDDVPFPLIINDERVSVPSIHVRANMMKVIENAGIGGPGRAGPRDQPAEAYILDDPNAPVMLSWMLGASIKEYDSFKVQLVRVTYPRDKPTIEQQLEKNHKAITWGINFDFNSDTIRSVSDPVLKEIAQTMADKPDWKLTVTGHTDNIGGHKYNLDLSQRRSAAVKKALVDRYRVDPKRLSTAGDGDSDPIDTNDTLEGRARNRRVELTLD